MVQSPEVPLVGLHQLLKVMIDKGASDLHITTAAPPLLRVDGSVLPLQLPPLGPIETKALCYSVLTEEQKITFEKNNELDLSFGVKNLSRFRANLFMQRGAVAGAFRAIPFKVRTFEDLGLPAIIAELASRPRGLVLVTGPTGSGKSTTLASIIDKINTETRQHIMTVEDPIEFLHPNKLSVVNQREVGSDTASFKIALKYVLRQDPDVVLIGEMRDLETIEAALTIAETGHLVFARCTPQLLRADHQPASSDVFPHQPAAQIRARCRRAGGVISQILLPRGRRAGARAGARNHGTQRRDSKPHPRRQGATNLFVMQAADRYGMQTLNHGALSALQEDIITWKMAHGHSQEPDELRLMIEGKAGAPGSQVS